jgi:porphobilinogen deaminase
LIGASCGDPVAALALVDEDLCHIEGNFMILSHDGSRYHTTQIRGTNPQQIAEEGAAQLLRHVDSIWR